MPYVTSVIPIRDKNPTRSFPVVTYALIAVNVVVFLFEQYVEQSFGELGAQALFMRYGVVPWALLYGDDPVRFVTPLSSMFMHGGWMHIIGNMWFLHIFGDNVEDRLGKGRFLAFYLLSGFAAAFAQVAIDPGSKLPMVGASGAVAGVLAGYVLLYPRARVLTLLPVFFLWFVEVPAFFFIFVWFGMQLLQGTIALGSIGDNVGGTAFFAHIGGFLMGLVLVKLFARRERPKRDPRPPRVHYLDERLPPQVRDAYRSRRDDWGFDRDN